MNSNLPDALWMKPAEAARALHLHPDTLARKVNSGEIMVSVQRTRGGRRRYRRSDVEWAASGSGFAHSLLADVAPLIHEVIEDAGIDLPMSAINELFKERYALVGEIKELWPDSATEEHVREVVAEELTGRDWPENGEGERAYREFRQDLEREAQQRGWRLTRKPVDQSEAYLDEAGEVTQSKRRSSHFKVKLGKNRWSEAAVKTVPVLHDLREGGPIMSFVPESEAPKPVSTDNPDYIICMWRPDREAGICE